MQFKPLGQRVFAKRLWEENVGILVKPSINKQICREAEVIEIGDFVEAVGIGDHISIAQYGHYEPPAFEDDKEKKYKDCLVVNVDDILGKILGGSNGNSN